MNQPMVVRNDEVTRIRLAVLEAASRFMAESLRSISVAGEVSAVKMLAAPRAAKMAWELYDSVVKEEIRRLEKVMGVP
jgi:hypothetical protein